MAEVRLKRGRLSTQQKFQIYEALYKLNVAFQSIAFEIERLDDVEAVPLEVLRGYRAAAEELRSGINHRVTSVPIMREESDWAHYGKLRIQQEKRLK